VFHVALSGNCVVQGDVVQLDDVCQDVVQSLHLFQLQRELACSGYCRQYPQLEVEVEVEVVAVV
jgi:hypothetical protein